MIQPIEQSIEDLSKQPEHQKSSDKIDTKPSLGKLLQTTGMWRASSIDCARRDGIPSGYSSLDKLLPDSGWPTKGLTELLHQRPGIGELRLLAPALASLSHNDTRRIIWVAPPYIPYAPALVQAGIDLGSILVIKPANHHDLLWVMEKSLASNSCSMVLAWPGKITANEVRRLQVASHSGNCLGVLFRSSQMARHASAAELRIHLEPIKSSPLAEQSRLQLDLLKRRGGWATRVQISLDDNLNRQTPSFRELIVPIPAKPHEVEKPSLQALRKVDTYNNASLH